MRWYENQAVIEAMYRKGLHYAKAKCGERHAQDVMQEAMMSLWKTRETISFEDETTYNNQIGSLLFKTISNRHIDFLARNRVIRKKTKVELAKDSSTKTVQYHYDNFEDVADTVEEEHQQKQSQVNELVLDEFDVVLEAILQEKERLFTIIREKDDTKTDFLQLALFEDTGMKLDDIAEHVGFVSTNLSVDKKRFLEQLKKALVARGITKDTMNALLGDD